MPAPSEIIAAPFTIYLAPVGEAFPTIAAAVAGNWFKLGTSGDKNYDDDGVTVNQPQTLAEFRGAGSTFPRKKFRTEEDVSVAFTLVDLTPEQYAKVLNDVAVTTVVGPPGHKSFGLGRGLSVASFALFARGMSPVDNALNAQFELKAVQEDAEKAPQFTKGDPAKLACQFTVIDAAGDADVGAFRAQTTA